MKPWSMSSWLVAVTAIFAAILFCSYLRLLVHLCSLSTSLIRAPRRRLSAINEAADLSLQSRSLGLEASDIDALPVAHFTGKIAGETTDCAVCLAEFKEGERVRRLPSCAHSFHISCIDAWFLSHSNCPLCRSEVQSSEGSVSGKPLLRSVETEQTRILRLDIMQGSGNSRESESGM